MTIIIKYRHFTSVKHYYKLNSWVNVLLKPETCQFNFDLFENFFNIYKLLQHLHSHL